MDLALLDLPARSLDELLDLLAATSDMRREVPDWEVPTVTLHLRSGAALTGSVIKHVAQRGGAKSIVFHGEAEDRVTYLQAEVVEGVTVLHPLRFTVRGGVYRRVEVEAEATPPGV